MRRLGVAAGLAVMLAACGGGEDALDPPQEAELPNVEELAAEPGEAAAATGEAGAQPSAAIPPRFHGVWDTLGSDCDNYTDALTTITADEVSFYEGGGAVTKVEADGKDIIVTLDLAPYGDEDPGTLSVRYSLMTTPRGVKLSSTNIAPPQQGEAAELQRCD